MTKPESLLKALFMPNNYFQFKQFTIHQDRCAMKVTTDACLFGAWVADKFQKINSKSQSADPITTGSQFRVLDIGTGTGLLSLMFAQQHPSAIIDAVEIEEEAYEQAKENAAASPFADRLCVLHGDVRTFPFTKKYDLIISNPPFYEKEIKSADSKKNIAHHHAGLLLDELLSAIKLNLSAEGRFCILLPFKRNEEIRKILFNQNLFVLKIVFIKQSTKHSYFRMMIMGKLKQGAGAETIIDEISIWDDQQQYTKEFVELMEDYYLNLTSQPPLRPDSYRESGGDAAE